MESAWKPDLVGDAPTLAGRLVEAIGRDVASGALAAGAKLPTHRDLARTLGVGIGTVTTAYAEAARRGLIEARVGSGSFVSAPAEPAERSGQISLAQNVQPLAPAERRFAATMMRLRQRPDLLANLDYAPAAGLWSHRRAAAGWLGRQGGPDAIDPARLIVTAGAQQAMALAFQMLCAPGDTLLVEEATFFGVKSLAQHLGLRLAGLAMDGEGLLPEALERAAAGGARVLYTMPTLQNPTGRIMSGARREEIAAIARRHGLWIVEDDIYGPFALGNAPPPLAGFAPDRTVYISGLSKIIVPGLRTGYLLAPDAALFDRLGTAIRALCYSPDTIGSLVATQWIEDGTADEIAGEITQEIRARTAMARAALGDALAPAADERCPHLWLPMSELEAERLAARIFRTGVEMTPVAGPIVGGGGTTGVRFCVGATRHRADLATALARIAAVLHGEGDDTSLALV